MNLFSKVPHPYLGLADLIHFNYTWKEVQLERMILDIRAVSRVIMAWLILGETWKGLGIG